MKRPASTPTLIASVIVFCIATPWALAKPTEIRVTLFGQTCLLTGPFNEKTLKALHELSPEQIAPPQTAEQVQQLLNKEKKVPALPAAMDRYRENLRKRLQAQLAFFDALAASKRSGRSDALLQAAKEHLDERRYKEFETLTKSLLGLPGSLTPASSVSASPVAAPSPGAFPSPAPSASPLPTVAAASSPTPTAPAAAAKEPALPQFSRNSVIKLFQSFSDWIEPFPEEEFHRAIQRIDVRYSCAFEENDEE